MADVQKDFVDVLNSNFDNIDTGEKKGLLTPKELAAAGANEAFSDEVRKVALVAERLCKPIASIHDDEWFFDDNISRQDLDGLIGIDKAYQKLSEQCLMTLEMFNTYDRDSNGLIDHKEVKKTELADQVGRFGHCYGEETFPYKYQLWGIDKNDLNDYKIRLQRSNLLDVPIWLSPEISKSLDPIDVEQPRKSK